MNRTTKTAALGRSLLAGPYLLWMTGFILIPLCLILWYGLTDRDGALTLANVLAIADPEHAKALWLSLGLSLVSTLICLVLAYPLAMILRGKKAAAGGFIVFIFILPMWMNFLLRTYAWMSILDDNGLINQFLANIGFFNLINSIFGTNLQYIHMINTQGAIVLGMVYNFLPFMVLPIFSVIDKIDPKVVEAAQDLGANGAMVFRKVIFPLSLPGVLSGVTMVFIPSVSTFALSRLLGGGKTLLLGDLIEMQFLGNAYNPHLGSAIALVMMVIVLVMMAVMNRFGEGEEGVAVL